MGTAQISNPEQRAKLNYLVQDTLEKHRALHITRVSVELGVNHETARDLMRPYLQKGIGHYNPREQAYFPNLL